MLSSFTLAYCILYIVFYITEPSNNRLSYSYKEENIVRYRTLGKTGLQVSEIGYGAWGIGQTSWIGADDQESFGYAISTPDLCQR